MSGRAFQAAGGRQFGWHRLNWDDPPRFFVATASIGAGFGRGATGGAFMF